MYQNGKSGASSLTSRRHLLPKVSVKIKFDSRKSGSLANRTGTCCFQDLSQMLSSWSHRIIDIGIQRSHNYRFFGRSADSSKNPPTYRYLADSTGKDQLKANKLTADYSKEYNTIPFMIKVCWQKQTSYFGTSRILEFFSHVAIISDVPNLINTELQSLNPEWHRLRNT